MSRAMLPVWLPHKTVRRRLIRLRTIETYRDTNWKPNFRSKFASLGCRLAPECVASLLDEEAGKQASAKFEALRWHVCGT